MRRLTVVRLGVLRYSIDVPCTEQKRLTGYPSPTSIRFARSIQLNRTEQRPQVARDREVHVPILRVVQQTNHEVVFSLICDCRQMATHLERSLACLLPVDSLGRVYHDIPMPVIGALNSTRIRWPWPSVKP